MNKAVKELWVTSLRSGDYLQAQGRLRKELTIPSEDGEVCAIGHCCLGILTDLYIKAHPTKMVWAEDALSEGYFLAVPLDENGKEVPCEGEFNFLPYDVGVWAGLEGINSNNPILCQRQELGAPFVSRITASMVNDEGSSFEDIAALIEEKL